jgi:shikimate kinase
MGYKITFSNQTARIFEIIGLPGSGKTTIASILNQNPQVQLRAFPFYRNPKHLPFFIRNTFSMLPTFINIYVTRNGRWFTREEIAWMIILNGWHHLLMRLAWKQKKIVILDQGPVFFLYWLDGFGPEILQGHNAQKWLCKVINNWATTIDGVIWLDAPNSVLIDRIRKREKPHLIKNQMDQTISVFLDDCRRAIEKVLLDFSSENKVPVVLCLDSSQVSKGQLVQKIFSFIIEHSESPINNKWVP